MPSAILIGLCWAATTTTQSSPEPTAVKLHANIEVTNSAHIAPGTYRIDDPQNDGAVRIVGEDITVDFAGVVLLGADETTPADQYAGRGVVIRGRHITVKNLAVHRYRVGIYAEDAPDLTLQGCDVSRNYRQHLHSTLEAEDLSDWLYGHENDQNEWLRYGSGIFLLNSPRATVTNCRARNGQNGLCLVRCDQAHVVDNDFSFMSGWGLAMWRSSRCDIYNNKLDWCIRGYSHGVYSRGQDSTGILVYEQCHDNVFAFNSATHGGDGFFLYAGNETLNQTGTGGCNNNLVYRNDFSHAAANGIEATFSYGNRFIENTLDECTHGVWAGYSFDSLIAGNTIRHCRNGVSIEHGRRNRIVANRIEKTDRGVNLWWDDDKDLLASKFGQTHSNCPSEENIVAGNAFSDVATGVRLGTDTNSRIVDNAFVNVTHPLECTGSTHGVVVDGDPRLRESLKGISGVSYTILDPSNIDTTWSAYGLTPKETLRLDGKKGKQKAFLSPDHPHGREFMFVDDWGPYDFSKVRIWPEHLVGGGKAEFQLLAPQPTPFRASVAGPFSLDADKGTMPQRLTLRCLGDGPHPFTLHISTDAQPLQADGVLLCADWEVKFYTWVEDQDPRVEGNWAKIIRQSPAAMVNTKDLAFAWGYRGPVEGVSKDHFATVAETEVELPAGSYRFVTLSDDGVRVLLDGKAVLTNWTQHGPTDDEVVAQVETGMHQIRIEHFEIDGYACLTFKIEPVR